MTEVPIINKLLRPVESINRDDVTVIARNVKAKTAEPTTLKVNPSNSNKFHE